MTIIRQKKSTSNLWGRWLVIMRHLISTICIVLLLWGCDNSTAVTAKPKVVRKKIVAPDQKTVKVSTQKTVRQAKTKPVAKQPAKTVIAKVDDNGAVAKKQSAAGGKPQDRQLVAKQNTTASAPNKPTDNVQSKKPAIRPKSEITVIEPAVKQPTQPTADSTVAGTKSPTPEPVVTAKISPDGVPALYNPAGKIDPFEPLFRERAAMAKTKKKIKREPRTPLERIDLSQLKLVGIILAASGNRALVEESSGKGYVVKTGTYIGINGGKIVKIEKELVTVEEQFEDVFGKIQSQKRELKLPKPPGEF